MTLLKVSLWSRFDWNRPICTIWFSVRLWFQYYAAVARSHMVTDPRHHPPPTQNWPMLQLGFSVTAELLVIFLNENVQYNTKSRSACNNVFNLQTSLALVNVDCLITSGAIHAYVPPVPELEHELRYTSRANPKSVIFNVLSLISPLATLSSNKTKKQQIQTNYHISFHKTIMTEVSS